MLFFAQSDIALFVSKSGDEYLCSCPELLPTFIIRHPTQEKAELLMAKVVGYLFKEQPFSLFDDMEMNLSTISHKATSEVFFLVECRNLLPGFKASGNSVASAVTNLNVLSLNYLKGLLSSNNQIKCIPVYNGYASSCHEVLPQIDKFSDKKEVAYNEMAKCVMDQQILEELKKQASSPIVITGSFHSGTSALALLLIRNGIFLGNYLNYAYDEQDISNGDPNIGPFRGLTGLIEHYYPNKQHSLSANELLLLKDFFFRFVKKKIAFPYWGWKSPISVFLMPLIKKVFPGVRFLHIIRDGRDVTLSPHSTFPNNDFGKLLYFDRTDIEEWEGIHLSQNLGKGLVSNNFNPPPTLTECEFLSYLWEKMSIIGAEYGATMKENYLQISFENLCLNPHETVSEISDFLGVTLDHNVLTFRKDRVNKFRNPPEWASGDGFIERIEKRCRKGLEYFGYQVAD